MLASPLTNLFYRGLKLISTYQGANFIRILRGSFNAISNGENVVVFPEDSSEGYLEELPTFYEGFLTCAEYCLKYGKDISIYVSYCKKKQRIYVFDAPVLYSEHKQRFQTREEISKYLLDRCNALNKIQLPQ